MSRPLRRGALGRGIRFAVILVIVAVFLFPVYWIFQTSLKSPDEIFAYPPVWMPGALRLSNFVALFSGGDARAVFNSFLISGVSTLLAMAIGTMAAYSMARFGTGGHRLALAVISLRMIPPIVLVFPLFLLFGWLGLIDRFAGLILAYTALNLPYVIWMMRSYVRDVPLELEESALLDGCSRWGVLWRIVVPLSKNGLIATSVFAFIMGTNEFVFALVLTRSEVITAPVQIAQYFSEQATYWARIGAISVLSNLPVAVAVFALQRYLVRGISLGAVKG